MCGNGQWGLEPALQDCYLPSINMDLLCFSTLPSHIFLNLDNKPDIIIIIIIKIGAFQPLNFPYCSTKCLRRCRESPSYV